MRIIFIIICLFNLRPSPLAQVVHERIDGWDSLLRVQVKIKLSLCVTRYHAIKTYWGEEVQFHELLMEGKVHLARIE
jgi:hypothetical protein